MTKGRGGRKEKMWLLVFVHSSFLLSPVQTQCLLLLKNSILVFLCINWQEIRYFCYWNVIRPTMDLRGTIRCQGVTTIGDKFSDFIKRKLQNEELLTVYILSPSYLQTIFYKQTQEGLPQYYRYGKLRLKNDGQIKVK